MSRGFIGCRPGPGSPTRCGPPVGCVRHEDRRPQSCPVPGGRRTGGRRRGPACRARRAVGRSRGVGPWRVGPGVGAGGSVGGAGAGPAAPGRLEHGHRGTARHLARGRPGAGAAHRRLPHPARRIPVRGRTARGERHRRPAVRRSAKSRAAMSGYRHTSESMVRLGGGGAAHEEPARSTARPPARRTRPRPHAPRGTAPIPGRKGRRTCAWCRPRWRLGPRRHCRGARPGSPASRSSVVLRRSVPGGTRPAVVARRLRADGATPVGGLVAGGRGRRSCSVSAAAGAPPALHGADLRRGPVPALARQYAGDGRVGGHLGSTAHPAPDPGRSRRAERRTARRRGPADRVDGRRPRRRGRPCS